MFVITDSRRLDDGAETVIVHLPIQPIQWLNGSSLYFYKTINQRMMKKIILILLLTHICTLPKPKPFTAKALPLRSQTMVVAGQKVPLSNSYRQGLFDLLGIK